MSDDPTKQDGRDRGKVAAGQAFEVQYFAEKAGISLDQARQLLQRYGNDRAKLMDEAKLLKGEI